MLRDFKVHLMSLAGKEEVQSMHLLLLLVKEVEHISYRGNFARAFEDSHCKSGKGDAISLKQSS